MTHTQPLLDLITRYAGLVRTDGVGPEVAEAWRQVAAEVARLDRMIMNAHREIEKMTPDTLTMAARRGDIVDVGPGPLTGNVYEILEQKPCN